MLFMVITVPTSAEGRIGKRYNQSLTIFTDMIFVSTNCNNETRWPTWSNVYGLKLLSIRVFQFIFGHSTGLSVLIMILQGDDTKMAVFVMLQLCYRSRGLGGLLLNKSKSRNNNCQNRITYIFVFLQTRLRRF